MFRPFAAAGQARAVRWEFEIGAANAPRESGDLRLEPPEPRILLASADRQFERLANFRRRGDSIFFDTRRYRDVAGRVTDTLMSGTAHARDGTPLAWSALPLAAGQTLWPIAPRVTVRQLTLGRADTTLRLPGDWMAALSTDTTLDRRAQALAIVSGLPSAAVDSSDAYVGRVAFGIDSLTRAAGVALLQRAIDSTNDPVLRSLFATSQGIQFDAYDYAVRIAHEYLVGFSLDAAIRGMHQLHALDQDSSMAGVRAALIAFHRMPVATQRIDSLQRIDDAAGQSLRALLVAYGDTRDWWMAAVRGLLTRRWLHAGSGWRSPAQLMAAFWGADSLPLPRIVPRDLPAELASPAMAGKVLLRYLVRPDNAVAPEWLAAGGVSQAFDVWRAIDWGAPLPVRTGSTTRVVLSPAQMSHAAPTLFGSDDEVQLDPAVTPLAAVAIIVHEWQHLVTTRRRWTGARPLALRTNGIQVDVRDDNPWLAEGFAEWATDEVLASGGAWGAWSRYTQAVKRDALARRAPDDPHLLGYRLVLALRARMPSVALRDLLVAHLDDLEAVARAAGVAGSVHAPARFIRRQPNATVVPEVSFSWTGGGGLDVSHRLIMPFFHPEH